VPVRRGQRNPMIVFEETLAAGPPVTDTRLTASLSRWVAAAFRGALINSSVTAVHRVPIGRGHGWASCLRRTTYDPTVTTCRAVLRSHPGFGGLDFSRIGSVVAFAHVIASLLELDDLGAHLSAGDRPRSIAGRTIRPARPGSKRARQRKQVF
jgi:hypothetical protein